jgi:hypothetical protein
MNDLTSILKDVVKDKLGECKDSPFVVDAMVQLAKFRWDHFIDKDVDIYNYNSKFLKR